MKKFAITSAAFTGQISYAYNEAGYLVEFIVDAELSEEQIRWVLKKLPLTLDEVQTLLKSDKIKITEVAIVVTFEMFWNRYDEKERSSKKKTLAKWQKMNETNQYKAFQFIPKYDRSLSGGIAKKYAETYLNAELWNN